MTSALCVDGGVRTRLAAVAAWDASLVHGAVMTLGSVAARLSVWRMRLGAVARSLDDPACWAGPAGQRAGAAMIDISAAATAVNAALEESLTAFERLAIQAAAAQELAEQAMRSEIPDMGARLHEHERLESITRRLAPDALGPDVDAELWPAAEALRRASAAAVAAEAAGEPLVRLGAIEAGAAVTFDDLAAAITFVGPVAPPVVPVGAAAADVAVWWAGLSAAAQVSAVRAAPVAVGALDGLPAWARDQANRLILARVLRDPATPPSTAFVAGVVSRRIAAEEAAGREVQLHLLDLAGNRVVLGLGDLDTADAVALLVPGVGNTPGDDLGRLTRDAVEVGDAARAAHPGLAVATAVWLGYRTPSTLPGIGMRTAAVRGGSALAGALDGLAAARAVAGSSRARTTVLAHSYGTVVVDEAADVPGRLAADALVLLGSPGMEDDAASLEAPEVFDAVGDGDLIGGLEWFGSRTGERRYGSTALPVDPSTGHSDYYDVERPTLAAIGEVVAGVRTAK
jgi:hypothetical protein